MKKEPRITPSPLRLTQRSGKGQANKALIQKLILVGVPIVLALVITGTVLAVLGIVSPGSLTYTAPPANTTMQSFTATNCASMPTYTTVVLNDTRNNQNYRVRKMPDGKCWMIDNLKLKGFTLTSANSNVSANFVIPANPVQDAATHNNGRCDATSITLAQGSGNLTCDGTASTATYVAGNPNTDNFRFAAYSDPSATDYSDSCQPGVRGTAPDTLTACGYLYNWYTATAGTGTYAISTVGTTAISSICPSGWGLPSGGSGNSAADNDLAVLNAAMYNGSNTASGTSNADRRKNWYASGPFSGSFAGYFRTGGFVGIGREGNWWSSATYNAGMGKNLSISNTNVITGNNITAPKYDGYAVRCIKL